LTRWLLALVAAVLTIAAGYLAFLNPGPVVVHLSPTRTVSPSLAAALLVSFGAGALLIGIVSALGAGARGWRSWRAARRARREDRWAASTTRARDLLWAGHPALARTELSRTHRGAPLDGHRVALLAEAHLQEGDPASARTLLERAIATLGPVPRLLDLLADAAEATGDRPAAVEALERARPVEPESPRLARHLRDLYTASGRWADATAVQRDLLLRLHEPAALAVEREVLRGLRYQAALADTDPRRAARVLVALAREAPEFTPAWVSAGDLLAAAGRRFAARRTWERGARMRPAGVLLERLERLDADRPERVTRLYRRLRRRHPDIGTLPLLHVRHLLAHGALDEAEAELSALPAALAAHPLALALRGEAHRLRGNHTLAADTFARALSPELGGPRFHCAACHWSSATWSASCPACHRWGTVQDGPGPAEQTPPAGATGTRG